MALFEGENLACQRGETLVFEDLNFAVEAGAALWLAGPNGSGKSSLLRLMAGLLPPAGGRLLWSGTPIVGDAHRARLRYLAHLDAVKSHLSAAENLCFWADYWSLPRADVPRSLERLGLAALADAPARRLSAGQRRRLGLARLALGPAALWLLDEPSAALDSQGFALLGELIEEARGSGGMVIFSSHDTLPVASPLRLTLEPIAS
jgi:heme exporter protein A